MLSLSRYYFACITFCLLLLLNFSSQCSNHFELFRKATSTVDSIQLCYTKFTLQYLSVSGACVTKHPAWLIMSSQSDPSGCIGCHSMALFHAPFHSTESRHLFKSLYCHPIHLYPAWRLQLHAVLTSSKFIFATTLICKAIQIYLLAPQCLAFTYV